MTTNTSFAMKWTGIVTLHNETFTLGGQGDWHRCFKIEPENDLARRFGSRFKITVERESILEDGDVVELCGDVAAPNNSGDTLVITSSVSIKRQPDWIAMSGLRVNVVEVASRGLVTDRIVTDGNWTCLIVEHNVWIGLWGRHLTYSAVYVDIGDGVLPLVPNACAGVVVILQGDVLEFSERGNMWAIHKVERWQCTDLNVPIIIRRMAVNDIAPETDNIANVERFNAKAHSDMRRSVHGEIVVGPLYNQSNTLRGYFIDQAFESDFALVNANGVGGILKYRRHVGIGIHSNSPLSNEFNYGIAFKDERMSRGCR
ncbi:uncharacterized protein MELLADRAFT_69630 [Melampsora larici-populina 98AG31]|uniref:Uncharacterized protein n=1 Tax=Melampsora larici-populina (strain 98AG31 / pathotype 3-4-7) TaxID=747676 RepID=F4SBF6_MELLP|nr:uncharacterized protein MELLADRAFT_69630 [Melampsora larici-populina 98AG31]EGF98021.1 hypothetical protein MELLADRAFT_69630 [Melampsora larici-populina 98AG31]